MSEGGAFRVSGGVDRPDAGRPQDQGRRHRATRRADPAAVELLERYQAAMRRDLAQTLDDLEPQPTGQATLDGQPDVRTLTHPQRAERWKLAILLADKLGASIDPRPPAGSPSPRRGAGPRAADF